MWEMFDNQSPQTDAAVRVLFRVCVKMRLRFLYAAHVYIRQLSQSFISFFLLLEEPCWVLYF